MGTRVAPSFANTHMGKFEDDHVHTYHIQPFIYARYLDDIFIIYQYGLNELHEFVDHLNSWTESMKFTMECARDTVSFLDTKVKLRDETLYMDLYCKPTDSHSYILYTSAHPHHCRKSITYSQFLQIRCICSNLTDFDKYCLDFASYFHERGYPSHLMQILSEPGLEQENHLHHHRVNIYMQEELHMQKFQFGIWYNLPYMP